MQQLGGMQHLMGQPAQRSGAELPDRGIRGHGAAASVTVHNRQYTLSSTGMPPAHRVFVCGAVAVGGRRLGICTQGRARMHSRWAQATHCAEAHNHSQLATSQLASQPGGQPARHQPGGQPASQTADAARPPLHPTHPPVSILTPSLGTKGPTGTAAATPTTRCASAAHSGTVRP